MKVLQFHAAGKPAPAGSKRAVPYFEKETGVLKAAIRDDSGERGYSWRDDVRSACVREIRRCGWEIPDRRACLFLLVEMAAARPASHYKRDGSLRPAMPDWCNVRPDATKMLRAVEDALNGIAWLDDARISFQAAHKVYDMAPGVGVVIGVLDEAVHGPAIGALWRAMVPKTQ